MTDADFLLRNALKRTGREEKTESSSFRVYVLKPGSWRMISRRGSDCLKKPNGTLFFFFPSLHICGSVSCAIYSTITNYPLMLNFTLRMNVAITRAKELLVVIGNPQRLQEDPYWKSYLQFALRNNLSVVVLLV